MRNTHTQQSVMPKIDLTKIKSMTEEDWRKIVVRVPFYDFTPAYLDYSDGSNKGRTNWVFKPKVYRTAKESGLSMLRTLNFMQ
jgi:hypothetical protein